MPPPSHAPAPDPDPFGQLYDRLGEPTFRRLVAAFYRRVRVDDLIGPMYPPEEWDAAEQRLAGFLIQRFGGPPTYSQQRGHPRLRMRHAPFAITPAAAERWLELMAAALDEAQVPPRRPLRARPVLPPGRPLHDQHPGPRNAEKYQISRR